MLNPHLIRTAVNNLKSTTLRTVLAMLGILVGTASVVAMVSTGQMATEEALKQFKSLGTDLFSMMLSNKGEVAPGAKGLTLEDVLNFQSASNEIALLAPYTMAYADMSFAGNTINGGIIGTTDVFAKIVNMKIKLGRFISALDHYEKYCVIGFQVYKQVKISNPLGLPIKLGSQIYTIIGVADPVPENSFLFQDMNAAVIIPIRTTSVISQTTEINNIIMRLKPNANIDNVKKALESYIQTNNINKEVSFRSAKELVKSMNAQHRIFTLLLSLIGSISLIVGGIGVMNIMLMSVLERRQEIGIRLALGAPRREIQRMFLTESILLSVIGGFLGVIAGIIVSLIVAEFLNWRVTVFVLPPLIGFTVSVLIGIFFGFYPAYKASQLDPIQTLRSE